MTARQGTGLTLAAAAAFLMFCAGCLWPFQIGFDIAAGWAFFLARVVPQITVNVNGVLTGVVGLTGFAVGLHLLLRWLYGATVTDSSENPPRRWQFRWTLGLTGLVVVMFAAGIATVGSLHQVGWLVTSPVPLIDTGRGPAAHTQSANNLKQLAFGLHNFNDAHEGRLSPGCTTDRFGNPLHGWQAAILPYIEEESLYKRIHFNRPWDDPENRPAFQSRISIFLINIPTLPTTDDGYALSHYAGNIHALPPGTGLRLPADFKDGTSNTLFIGEVSAGLRPWGHPLNLRDPGRGIRKSADAFAGPWPGDITLFVLADGSVRSVRNTISPAVLKALATPAGGEDVSGTDW